MNGFIYGLALAGMLLSACAKEIAETTGGISGVVSDVRSHEPLAGASVSLLPVGRTVATGADGRYRFGGLDAQEYVVQVSGEGYQSDRKTVHFRKTIWLLIALSMAVTTWAQKPKWVGNTLQELNNTYKFVEIVSTGNTLEAARLDAKSRLAEDAQLQESVRVYRRTS